MSPNPFEKAFINALIPTIPIEKGGIYAVADDPESPIIRFPEDLLRPDHPKAGRTFHEERYVLVVQDDSITNLRNINSVLVAPCSSRGTGTEVTVVIPNSYLELRDDTVARLHLTQPILQIFLKRKVGQIPSDDPLYSTLQAILFRIIGQI